MKGLSRHDETGLYALASPPSFFFSRCVYGLYEPSKAFPVFSARRGDDWGPCRGRLPPETVVGSPIVTTHNHLACAAAVVGSCGRGVEDEMREGGVLTRLAWLALDDRCTAMHRASSCEADHSVAQIDSIQLPALPAPRDALYKLLLSEQRPPSSWSPWQFAAPQNPIATTDRPPLDIVPRQPAELPPPKTPG